MGVWLLCANPGRTLYSMILFLCLEDSHLSSSGVSKYECQPVDHFLNQLMRNYCFFFVFFKFLKVN